MGRDSGMNDASPIRERLVKRARRLPPKQQRRRQRLWDRPPGKRETLDHEKNRSRSESYHLGADFYHGRANVRKSEVALQRLAQRHKIIRFRDQISRLLTNF